jgi:DNA-binding transcriptional ArsR family regulator
VKIGDHQPEIDTLLREYFPEADPEPHLNGSSHKHRWGEYSPTDDKVIEAARAAKNAAKFASLFDEGDTSGYGSASEADLALVSMIAFYTQDVDQLDRLYRRSALYRKKWERYDYREKTINRAINNLAETYQARKNTSSSPLSLGVNDDEVSPGPDPDLVWVREMGKPKPREYIAEPTIGFARWGGSAKSMTATDFALRYTNIGGKWLGFKLCGKGKALFVDFELDADEFNRRVRALAKGAGYEGEIRGLGYLATGDMPTPHVFAKVRALCEKHKLDVVIIDSVGPALEGDVGSSKDVIAFHRRYITPLRAQGVTPILIDHQARAYSEGEYQSKGAYGNSYKEHLARSIFQVEPKQNAGQSVKLLARVRHKKANFSGLEKPFDIEVVFGDGSVTITRSETDDSELIREKTVSIDTRILSVLEGEELDKYEIAEKVGQQPGSVANRLTALKNDGKIVEVRKEGRTPIYSSSSLTPRENDNDEVSVGTSTEAGLFEERF